MSLPPPPQVAFIRNPNEYSCISCCYAMAMGCRLDDIYAFLGHDGSQFIGRERRGVNDMELQYFALSRGYKPVTLYRKCHTKIGGEDFEIPVTAMFDEFFKWTILDPVIIKYANKPHAVLKVGGRLFDPARTEPIDFTTMKPDFVYGITVLYK